METLRNEPRQVCVHIPQNLDPENPTKYPPTLNFNVAEDVDLSRGILADLCAAIDQVESETGCRPTEYAVHALEFLSLFITFLHAEGELDEPRVWIDAPDSFGLAGVEFWPGGPTQVGLVRLHGNAISRVAWKLMKQTKAAQQQQALGGMRMPPKEKLS